MAVLLVDELEQRLLGLLQTDFPLSPQPFDELALKLALSPQEVIARIQALKHKGLVRQISPVLDARKLGFQSTLVAIKVPPGGLEKADRVIAGHSGISHAYLRDYPYNLWITLSLPHGEVIAQELAALRSSLGAEGIFDLPATRIFKLKAYFGAENDEVDSPPAPQSISQPLDLSPADRRILNQLQQDLELTSRPFDSQAAALDLSAAEYLAACRSLLERGIIRRFGAAINHRKTGFAANAMVCWQLPPEQAEFLGEKLASFRAVSHCYLRRTNPLWPYNLFAMLHGRTPQECQSLVQAAADGPDFQDYIMLYSTREFKKTRVIYRV